MYSLQSFIFSFVIFVLLEILETEIRIPVIWLVVPSLHNIALGKKMLKNMGKEPSFVFSFTFFKNIPVVS